MTRLPDLLPKLARNRWEGWFVIGIGDGDCAVRWHKTHVYRRRRLPWPMHPVSALEGLREPEIVTFVATAEAVHRAHRPLDAGELRAAEGCFRLEVPDALEWQGAPRHIELRGRTGHGLSYDLKVTPRDRLQWIRAPGLLTYVGLMSECSGTVTAAGAGYAFHGLGILEHAWGGMVPFDPLALVRGPWHWDVLSFGDGAAVAGLSLPLPLLGSRGVRAGGRVPGHEFAPFGGFHVDVLARVDGLPSRWVGRMTSAAGELRYECVAATPVARAAQDVYFLGTEFEASFAGARFEGRGFTECGGPT